MILAPVPKTNDGADKWREMFSALRSKGKLYSPRGQKTIEIENFHVDIDPLTDRFCSFTERKLSLRYLAGEFAWYLGADPNDTMIEALSTFWNKIRNLAVTENYETDYVNGSIWNSNYGVPFFKQGQFNKCLHVLTEDPDSRQAVVVINRSDIALSAAKDKICTNAVMFRIRDNKLNMTVQMRSNDIVLGLGYDLPIFSFIMEMLYVYLRDRKYPDLQMGIYHHTSGSFHIYEKHFDMMDKIIDSDPYYCIRTLPIARSSEVTDLLYRYPIFAKRVLVTREPKDIPVDRPSFVYDLLKWIAFDAQTRMT